MKLLTMASMALSLAVASPVRRQMTCNGSPDLCGRNYSNVSFIGAHDSPFVGSIDDPTVNQMLSVTDQLNSGIRFLQGQTHKNLFGQLSMCHTSCMLEYAGSTQDYLTTVKDWMDQNPTDILTLLLTNGDNVDMSMFDAAFKGAGLNGYAWQPPTTSPITIDQFPTLGDMITSKKRLMVFVDYGANSSEVPYILSEFDNYIFETPYDTTDPNFAQCSLNRPPGGSPDGRMYIMNHFLDKELVSGVDIPDNDLDSQTNAATGTGSIGAQAALCMQAYGRPPNFVLVDMFNRGDVFTAQHALNFP